MRLDELSRLLRAADPAAVTTPQVVLDRVIREASGLSWAVWAVPHRWGFMLDRFTLFKHAEQHELDLPPDHQLPPTVLLLARPTPDQLGDRPGTLGLYWRRLFHLAAHRELEARTPADVRSRVEALGPAAFEEARAVLREDGHLAADATDRQAFVEFAAFYLELRLFAWNLLPVCFPSLPDGEAVEAVLQQDVDARPLYHRTRLSGAPDPAPRTDDQSDEQNDFYYRLDRQATRAAATGDTVAAAILHTRAARVAPAALTGPAHEAAVRDVHKLVARLDPALGLTAAEVDGWKAVLPSLLDKADQGTRPVEAGILYDLQRACLDHELDTFALDPVLWALEGRPIKRKLDSQPFVRVPVHLRSAARRLTAARLSDAARKDLAGLLRAAQEKTEDRLRARFRPVLTDALQDAGLTADTLPEQAARAKTVEELLDRIVATGFLTYADLRDSIARGQVKLPDLGGPDEYLRGDLLLRLDRRLGTLLDGVYRRGEFYSRWLERGTSLLFGTQAGRWATRNVLLPVGAAFLAAQFVWLLVYERRHQAGETPAPPAAFARPDPLPVPAEVWEPLAAGAGGPGALGGVDRFDPFTPRPPADPLRAAVKAEADLTFFGGWNAEWWFHLSWLAVAGVLLLFVRSAGFRAAVVGAGRGVLRAGRAVLWDAPRRLWRNPLVRTVLTSWPLVLLWNWAVEPLLFSGLLWLSFDELWRNGPAVRVVTVLAAVFVLRSNPGRAAKEVLVQWAAEGVASVRGGLIPGAVRAVGQFFRELTGAVEWVLARGDDWLRLRGGGGPLSVLVRVLAGVVWAPVAFLLRLYLVVLIEPAVNPLKLPLSLLFAKFVYPLLAVLGLFSITSLSSPLVAPLAAFLPVPYSWSVAWLFVIGTFYLLPDAVTFLFWEMRENWRLYRANRPTLLRPEAVGPHGETVVGLLRPGFHSGIVPRRYARLRAAERRAAASGDWQDARTHRAALRDAADGVRRFVVRELAAVLNPSKPWGGRTLFVGDVHLGTNRIRVDLLLLGSSRTATLEFEDRSGWLVGGWAEPGWAVELPAAPAQALENTLAYLYKRAGVELVREQVRAGLPPAAVRFDVVSAGLLVWYEKADRPVLYDLRHRPDDLRPRTPDNLQPAGGPVLSADRVYFGRARLTWSEWVRAWPQAGGDRPAVFGPACGGLCLLPPRLAVADTVEFTPERIAAALPQAG